MSSPALLPPSHRVGEGLWAVTWAFATDTSLLGGESPPSNRIAFPLVTALRAALGVFPALVVFYITPGHGLYLDKVELGGIEPQISVWLGVDLCCLVSVSCDDAV